MRGVAMRAAADWAGGILDRDVPPARRALRALAIALPLALLLARPAFAGIIEDAVRSGLEGMLQAVVDRVNSMSARALPQTFTNLFDGASASHAAYAKAAELYGTGVARSVAASVLSLAMLVRLVGVARRAEASATFPMVREVVSLLVVCSVYTWLVGHAWDLVRALFEDLSALWTGWSASSPRTIGDIGLGDAEGLAALFPMLVSSMVCLVLADAASIVTHVVVWARGMQVYFMAVMSPIPLALLAMGETRQMGIGFLRNLCSLLLGYAALAFVLDLFPTLLQMAVESSLVAGGAGEMVLSVTAACVLQLVLVLKCGSWARDVLGG